MCVCMRACVRVVEIVNIDNKLTTFLPVEHVCYGLLCKGCVQRIATDCTGRARPTSPAGQSRRAVDKYTRCGPGRYS